MRALWWLAKVDPSVNHRSARKKHEPSTGNWLLKSDGFEGWKSKPRSFMWLHGIRM